MTLRSIARTLAVAPILLGFAGPADARVSVEQARSALVRHDCCGRLVNTVIAQVGSVRVGERSFTIFDLDFTNPISHHGMQRIAIFDGTKFVGSYLTDGAKIVVKGTTIIFSCSDAEVKEFPDGCQPEYFQQIDLADQKLPKTMLISGYLVDLEQTI